MIWNIRSRTLDLSREARIMGILNTTPDSFSDGGKFLNTKIALKRAIVMIAEGATIIDIGGESTRPGAPSVSAEEEISRTIPVIRELRGRWDGYISIDTQKAEVARAALDAGADIVNDVSGLSADPEMARVCMDSDCGIVIMHMRGTPALMQNDPVYENVVAEIHVFFQQRLAELTALGIASGRLCFDPGIGFGKTFSHNLELLRNLGKLAPQGSPLLLGASRKSFISKLTASESPADRDASTVAITALARQAGVMLHRVHEVKSNFDALRVAEVF